MKKYVLLMLAFFLLASALVYADNYTATVNIVETTGIVSENAPILSNQSIIYYLKTINKTIINNTIITAPTKSELESLKEKTTSKTSPPSNKIVINSKLKTIKWDGILDSGNSSLTFNEVEFSGGKYRLSLNFIDNWRSWFGHRAIEVKVNGITQECQSRWGIIGNLSVDQLVLHPDIDQDEVCLAQIGGTEYVLTINNFNKTDGKYSMDLTSPIIPSDCPETITGSKGLSSPAC